jgi:hypothetical protein
MLYNLLQSMVQLKIGMKIIAWWILEFREDLNLNECGWGGEKVQQKIVVDLTICVLKVNELNDYR